MKRPIKFGFVTAAIVLLALSSFSYYYNSLPGNEGKLPYFPLMIPPAAATSYGNPLDTNTIGFMAYYYYASGFTLASTVTAWVNYTDSGSYYDGYVRVWQDVTGATYDGDDVYIDVSTRVRSDGWVLAWLDRAQASKGYIPFWGVDIANNAPAANPVANATCPTRAIERVFYAAGISFPGYNAIKMYDYQYPTATKFVMFGNSTMRASAGTNTFYFFSLFPSSTNAAIVAAYASVGGDYGSSGTIYAKFGVDVNTALVTCSSTGTFWNATDVSPYVALDKTTRWWVGVNVEGSPVQSCIFAAIMIWLS